eukprot:202279_1
MDIEKQIKYIKQILNVINKLNIECDNIFYFILIKLSMQHNDLNKLYMYYNEIENKTEKDVIVMTQDVIQYFKNNYDGENIDNEMSQFKSWVLDEYKNYNSLPLLEQEDSFQEFKNMICNELKPQLHQST